MTFMGYWGIPPASHEIWNKLGAKLGVNNIVCFFVNKTISQLVYNPFSQFIFQREHYSQLQLGLKRNSKRKCYQVARVAV